jgi:hypothetical protein
VNPPDTDAPIGSRDEFPDELPAGPNVGRVFRAVAAFLGVGCTLYVIILVGGFAVVLGNPYAVAAIVALVVVAAGVVAWRWRRTRRLPECPTGRLRRR